MATNYGTSIASLATAGGGLDFDPYWRRISGPPVVLYAVARRFVTRKGSLWWAPDEGYDLRDLIEDGVRSQDLPNIEQKIIAEAERDERVLGADATVSFDSATETLRVDLSLTLAEGTFRLVLVVSAVSASLVLAG